MKGLRLHPSRSLFCVMGHQQSFKFHGNDSKITHLAPGVEKRRKLSPVERKFQQLLGEVKKRQQLILSKKAHLDKAVLQYAALVAPVEIEEDKIRRRLMVTLGAAWRRPKYLGKRQKEVVGRVILLQGQQLRGVGKQEEEEALKVLLMEIMAEEDRLEEASIAKVSEAMGVDLSKFDPDLLDEMDPSGFANAKTGEEFVAEYQRQAKQMASEEVGEDCDDEFSKFEDDSPQDSKLREASRKREEEMIEAKKRTLGVLYKQLAKALHPDLERDHDKRREKEKQMQEVIGAYQKGDLFTLLRIELEVLQKGERNLAAMAAEKLKVYCDLLSKQIEELKSEYFQLEIDPRYYSIRIYLDALGPDHNDWDEVKSRCEARLASMMQSLAVLEGSPQEQKNELKELVAAYNQQFRYRRKRSGVPF